MDKTDITISDASFYQKIINKYSKGKRNIFSFPMMIFRKSSGDFFSQKINMDILIQLHLHNQNIIPSLIVKSARSTKEMLLWIENLIPHFILKPTLLRSGKDMSKTARILQEAISGALQPGHVPANRVSIVSFTSSVFFKLGNMILNLNKVLNPEIQRIRNNLKSKTAMSYSYVTSSNVNSLLNNTSLKNAILCLQVPYRASLPGGAMGRQLNYGGYVQIISPETLIIKNSSGLLIKGTYSLKETYQNPATFIKPVLRHEHHKYGSEAFFTMQRGDALKNRDNFYFQNKRKIEQAVEEVKKIAQEAKEIATKGQGKPSVEMDIHYQVDLNKLSDQVYQNIERRLRIEKERRGL